MLVLSFLWHQRHRITNPLFASVDLLIMDCEPQKVWRLKLFTVDVGEVLSISGTYEFSSNLHSFVDK